jgi:hypothetical protein
MCDDEKRVVVACVVLMRLARTAAAYADAAASASAFAFCPHFI